MPVDEGAFLYRKKLSIYWYNKASDFLGSAGALWASMDNKRSKQIVEELGLPKGFSMAAATPPVYRMLCGMAMELIYTAIIVAKGEEPRATHKLIELSKKAGVDTSETQRGLLKILTEAIVWHGKYPVPKKKENMVLFEDLSRELLFDRVYSESRRKVTFITPNKRLGWDSFCKLWRDAEDVYWQNHSD